MGTQIRPHPHPSQKKNLPITAGTNVNPHLMNVYLRYFLNVEDGVLFYTVVGMGLKKKLQTDFFASGNTAIAAYRKMHLFVYVFLSTSPLESRDTCFYPRGIHRVPVIAIPVKRRASV